MPSYRSLNHTKWSSQYHVVFIPKSRKKAVYGELCRRLGELLRDLAEQRESRVEEGHLLTDHVHNNAVDSAEVLGGTGDRVSEREELDSHCPRVRGRPRNFVGQHFWARGYFVSTLDRGERAIRAYIQQQEQEDRRLDQLPLE